MVNIHELTYHVGARALYENCSLFIKEKDKIGLVGLNGTGKSTLLKLITGRLTPDGGYVNKAKDVTIGFLDQDLLSFRSQDSIRQVAIQAFEEVLHIEKEIERILEQMANDYQPEQVEQLGVLQERLTLLDGYEIQAKTDAVLIGMGFSNLDLERPLEEFSGGWRMRVMLAKLLLQKPDLLMLDEPTNHLDLVSIQWLEGYLQSYDKAFIVVSHDRRFLDNVTNKTVEVANKQLYPYAGNYSFYETEKAAKAEQQENSYKNQQRKIEETERFIERFRYKASKAKQAQSRIKMLEKIERIEPVTTQIPTVKFNFSSQQPAGKVIIRISDLSKRYGPLELLKKTHATIERGDKIALVGANGKGKSTLLRIIAQQEPADQGQLEMGHQVVAAFYAQHQLESLNLENDIFTELQEVDRTRNETELRKIAGMFLFKKDDVYKKIKILSGGEKSRVALAKVLLSHANFLILDEPTNHLDMISIDILAQTLESYKGTCILVSHDRHFVSKVANKIWYIENQQIREYPGDYSSYAYWQENHKGSVSG
jgi:ATP-binding cassette, subfamily F, member 3